MRELRQAEDALARDRAERAEPETLSDAERETFVTLGPRLPALWEEPEMTSERKKALLPAARLAPATARTKHKTLLNFVSEGTWSDAAVLAAMREAVLPALEAHGPVRFWITDETSMAKKGEHSVGVARQY